MSFDAEKCMFSPVTKIRQCTTCGLVDYLDDKLLDKSLGEAFYNHKKYCKKPNFVWKIVVDECLLKAKLAEAENAISQLRKELVHARKERSVELEIQDLEDQIKKWQQIRKLLKELLGVEEKRTKNLRVTPADEMFWRKESLLKTKLLKQHSAEGFMQLIEEYVCKQKCDGCLFAHCTLKEDFKKAVKAWLEQKHQYSTEQIMNLKLLSKRGGLEEKWINRNELLEKLNHE